MSQILDAINKAEKQRQAHEKPKSREDLYRSLTTGVGQNRRTIFIPVASASAVVAGLVYMALQTDIFAHFFYQHDNKINKKIVAKENKLLVVAERKVAESQSVVELPKQLQHSGPETAKTNVEEKIAIINKLKPKTHKNLVTLTPIINKKKNIEPLVKLVTIEKKSLVNKGTHKLSEQLKQPVQKQVAKSGGDNNSFVASQVSSGVSITAIVYHPSPTQRFALIQGAKVKEGDVIPGTNTTVIKILRKNLIVNNGSGDMLLQ